MRITPTSYSQFNTHFCSSNTTSKNQNSTANMSPDEFLSSQRKNESYKQKIIRKIIEKTSPRTLLENELNELVTLRNKNCPDDKLDINFRKDEDFKDYKTEDLKYLKQFIYLPGNSRQLDYQDLYFSFIPNSQSTKKQIDNIVKYKLLYDNKERRQQLSLNDILIISDTNTENIEKIISLGLMNDIKGRRRQLRAEGIISLAASLPKEKEKAEKVLKTIEKRELLTSRFQTTVFLAPDKAVKLARKSDEEFDNIEKSGILKYHNSFEADFVDYLPMKETKQRMKLITLFTETDITYNANEISDILRSDDKIVNNFIKIYKSGFHMKSTPKGIHIAKLDDNIIERFEKAKADAKTKKDILKDGENDLTDEQIDNFFSGYSTQICDTIYTIGLPAFEFAYSTKLDGLENILKLNDGRNYESFQPKLKKLLDDKSISPDERIDKFRIIGNLSPQSREMLYPFIKPHIVTTKYLKDANEIWAQRGKFFDEKYNEFCNKFKFSPDNKKIKQTIERIATVNKKGHKILYSIGAENLKEVIKQKNINEFNQTLYRMIFDSVDVEYDEITAEKLNLIESPYIGTVLYGSDEFRMNFKELLEIIKENPEKNIDETFNSLGHNLETKRQFQKVGINYDKWVTTDKNSFISIKTKTDVEKAREAALINLEKDLNDKDFLTLPQNETSKIFKALEEKGYTYKPFSSPHGMVNGQAFAIQKLCLCKGNERVTFDDLKTIVKIIKKEINSNDFWFKKDSSNNAKQINQAKSTVLNHILKLRVNEIKEALTVKNLKETEIKIQKTDMNKISHSLFLGNQSGCCTAIASPIGNDFAAPRYIIDKCIQAIEVADGNEFIGNTMCYIANVDGKPSLVLDNIEIKTKYQYNNKIRDAILDYAKKLCTEIGKPDMHIYAGPERHKVDLDEFPKKQHEVQILGETNGEDTYIDYCGERIIDGIILDKVSLYKIR